MKFLIAAFSFVLAFTVVNLSAADQPQKKDLTYGDLYLQETEGRISPLLNMNVGYALDLTNSYVDMHSLTASAQVRLWKFVSTGVFTQFVRSSLSSAGKNAKDLENHGLRVQIPDNRWGAFSLTQMELMIGRWNIFNFFPLEATLLGGGGAGALNQMSDLNNASNKTKFSYLWSVEQRFMAYGHYGVVVGLFGHRGGTFFNAGFNTSF